MRSIHVGNVEIVLCEDGTVDEIFVNNNGRCVFHLEQMSDNHYWCAAYDHKGNQEINLDIGSSTPIDIRPRTDAPESMDD